MVGGLATLGIMAGGLVGQTLGLRAALGVAALGSLASYLWLLFSPLRGLRDTAGWQLAEYLKV